MRLQAGVSAAEVNNGILIGQGEWELYVVATDRGETHNLAQERPDVYHSLLAVWHEYVEKSVSLFRPTSNPEACYGRSANFPRSGQMRLPVDPRAPIDGERHRFNMALPQRLASGDLAQYRNYGELPVDSDQLLLCGMVRLPEGGYPEKRFIATRSVDAFWIDATEVTNAQLASFVAATGFGTTAQRLGYGVVITPPAGGQSMPAAYQWWCKLLARPPAFTRAGWADGGPERPNGNTRPRPRVEPGI
jgi:hypothetical protein